MKKIWFPHFCILVLFVVSSCEKTEDEYLPETMEVKIFMSSPEADGDLKSATSEMTQIMNGDTIDLMNVHSINVIFSAEDQSGFHVQGKWSVVFIEDDITINNPDIVLLGTQYHFAEAPMIAVKYNRLGLYRATFDGPSQRISFLVRHFGMPGMLGDELEEGAAFRLAKDVFQGDNYKNMAGYTVYIKFNQLDNEMHWGGLEVDNNLFQALVTSSNYTFTMESGYEYQGKNVRLHRCKYAMGYLTATLIEEDIKPYNGTFSVVFYYGSYGGIWRLIPSIYKSDWRYPEGHQIVFKVM